MKWIIFYDPKEGEIIDFFWDEDRPEPPLIDQKVKQKPKPGNTSKKKEPNENDGTS